MNRTMEDARKGAKDSGRLLDAEANPIMMGDMITANSRSEKYLGDQIHEAFREHWTLE